MKPETSGKALGAAGSSDRKQDGKIQVAEEAPENLSLEVSRRFEIEKWICTVGVKGGVGGAT